MRIKILLPQCVSRFGWFCVLLCVLGAQVCGAVGRKGPELRNHSGPFSLWGLDISAAVLSDESTTQAIDALIPYAKYGINSVVLSFQPRGSGLGAFAADGSIADQALSKRIRNLSRATVDRWMVPVIRIFSSDRRARLESLAAYERALTEVGRMFRRNSDVIINIGCLPGVADGEELAKYVRVLRDEGYRGLVGLDLDAIDERRESGMPVEKAKDFARSVDILFCSEHPGETFRPYYQDPNKPTVFTVVVEDREKPGKARPGSDGLLPTVAQKKGLFCIARIPSCLEGRSPRFDIGGQDAQSDIGVAWYLREVSDAQLSLHGPIEESKATPSSEITLLDPGETEEGFVPLFDGQTLKGWTILSDSWQSFSPKDGVIGCDASSPNTYLRTARRYSDFVLRLDAKIVRGGNSGIFIRAPLWGRSSMIGFELQIEGLPSPKPRRDSAGAIYDVLPPKVDAMKPPGEWNAYEITCHGPHVRITINNQLVQDFNMDEIPKMKDRLREGVIGLQDHSDKVWFRKIRIKELR